MYLNVAWLRELMTHDPSTAAILCSDSSSVPAVGAVKVPGAHALNYSSPELIAALIDAHARIWTQQRETRGTLTQSVPGVLLEGWKEDTPAYVHGVRNDSLFRGNYGIVNLSPEPRQFLVIANGNHGKGQEVVTVPGYGVLHKGMPALAAGDLSIHFEPLGGSGRWHAYSSSVDNLSGSSWTVPAMQPRINLQY